MTRKEVYDSCLEELKKSNCLLMELATGFGKSKIAIDLVNALVKKNPKKKTSLLLLVAKNVHKQTWKDEISKWGGLNIDNVVMECYESLKKHVDETFDFIVLDEVHHIKSELRMELFSKVHATYRIGLSATIPQTLKQYFKYRYHTRIVSCDIVEAIEDEILPEPQILLFPLELDNISASETWEINPKAKGPVVYAGYNEYWKYKRSPRHVIFHCTQRQKSNEFNSLIKWEREAYMRTRREPMKIKWLHDCGKRLEFYANCKNNIVKGILKRLRKHRTITFCKTIEQSEVLGKNCIHSKNNKSTGLYEKFNNKEVNHITTVNILNENANLVDCKYAIFANIVSSEIMQAQRVGRALRHKSPVIIVPYYKGTREQEIVFDMFKDYNKDYIKVVHSIKEI